MKLEEKRNRIQNYCHSFPGCLNCVLESWCTEKINKGYLTRDIPENIADGGIAILNATGADFETATMKVEDLSTGNVTEISTQKEAVNHPDHYQGPHECIEVMEAMFGREAVKHFCMCNAFKYRFRAGMKNGEEDIKKAEWYEEYLIKMGGIDNGM